MITFLIAISLLVICLSAWTEYQRTSDPINPTVIFLPMMTYTYVLRPLALTNTSGIEVLFPNMDSLAFVHIVNLAFISAFCIGMAWHPPLRASLASHFASMRKYDSAITRRNTFRVSLALGIISNFVFWYSVHYSGGPFRVFSQRKPFLLSPFGSGYIDELTLLSFPAVLLFAIAIQGKLIRIQHLAIALFIASPHIVMGTIGGRRGPAFLIIATFLISFIIVRRRKISLKWVVAALALSGVFLLVLNEYRGDLFRTDVRSSVGGTLGKLVSNERVDPGDEYVAASATILLAHSTGKHYWGSRYFTWFVIRPIPSRLWPSKYVDMGMEWMVLSPGTAGFSIEDWNSAVGFVPAGGSAGGFISDLFLEFSWLGMFLSFLIGRTYARGWYLSQTKGGYWTLIYIEMLILSIYLPSQNLEAWLYRLMLLSLLCFIFWRVAMPPMAAQPIAYRSTRANQRQ